MGEVLREVQRLVCALEKGMKEKGIGWDELQRQTGVTWCTVRHWKLGVSVPNVRTAVIALDAVGYELQARKKETGGQ